MFLVNFFGNLMEYNGIYSKVFRSIPLYSKAEYIPRTDFLVVVDPSVRWEYTIHCNQQE